MLYTSPWSRFELTTSIVICTDCISSCKYNYHAFTSTTAPIMSHSRGSFKYKPTNTRLRHDIRLYWCNQYISLLMLWVRISIRARCTTLCDKVCQWLAKDRWISPGPPLSSTNNTGLYSMINYNDLTCGISKGKLQW
jgi:hypothetical protein